MSTNGLQRGKDTERAIARKLAGRRIGNTGKSTPDVVNDLLAIECKSRQSLPLWLMNALAQAVTSAPKGKTPAVILHLVGNRHDGDIVCLRLRDFQSLLKASKIVTRG